MRLLPLIVQLVLALLTFAGLGYYVAAMWAARAYAREFRLKKVLPDAAIPVSLLKPLRGFDAGMYEAFRSHCTQTFADEYEILFGVSTLDDPAVVAVHRLQQEFPERSIRLIECPLALGANGKVSTLAQLLPHARFAHIVVNDSDIFVPPRYLQHIVNEFAADAKLGMVTALYRGRTVPDALGRTTLWSRCENLTLSTEFVPGVLLARRIEGKVQFALGATLAIRRDVLEGFGGFPALADVLADDYQMGLRTIRSGHRIVLSPDVVQTAVPAYHWSGFISHQVRWMRTVRDERPAGYLGICFTFGLPWALLAVLASAAAPWSLALLSITLLGRVALALSVGVGVLGDTQVLRDIWVLPIRDVLGACLWLAAYAGDTVEWRGLKFRLHKGSLTPIP